MEHPSPNAAAAPASSTTPHLPFDAAIDPAAHSAASSRRPSVVASPADAATPRNMERRALASSRAKDDSLKGDETPQRTSTPTNGRKGNASKAAAAYTGMRIPYLKKEDGQPFWRKDIQFLFLSHVFHDETRVFTKASTGSAEHTFAEIYIDAMAKSSKCSGTLKEKLTTDHTAAIDMAMICLLVNVGRMNTTLNFFPEMRARVRTYHSIPCLQAQQGGKGLQDGPRLKSILKGATEDSPQPTTRDEIMTHARPRTNPVNLVFVLAQYAPKVSEEHFPASYEFFDLFLKDSLSSKSRARAFLWLVWWYLESDFSEKDALNNPFGAGERKDADGSPFQVPVLEILSDEQAELENVDTQEEKEYGEAKRLEREAILADDVVPASTGSRRGQKPSSAVQQAALRRDLSAGSDASDSNRSPGRLSQSPSRRQGYHANYGRSISPPSGFRAINDRPQDNRLNQLQDDEGSVAMQRTPSTGSRRGGRGGAHRRGREAGGDAFAFQPPLAPTPLHHTMNPYQATPGDTSMMDTPDGDGAKQYANGSNQDAPGSSGETGRKVRKFVSLEQQRRQRTERILWEQIRHVQAQKRGEHRKRGALLEAMIKCKLMPDGWDSEDDEPHRSGGLDFLLPGSRPAFGADDNQDDLTPVGDAGALAKRIAAGARRFGKGVDGVSVPRPKSLNGYHGNGLDDGGYKDGGTPASTVPIVHTARMAIDDPRRKRPYKPRAKRNPDLAPQLGKIDIGLKRKRGGSTRGSSRGGRGRGGRASVNRAGDQGVPLGDFLRGADEVAGSEVSEKPPNDDDPSVLGDDVQMKGEGDSQDEADDDGDTEDAGDDAEELAGGYSDDDMDEDDGEDVDMGED